MTLRILLGSFLSVTCILSSALCMIFFIGSYGIWSRIILACVLGTAGIGILALGVGLFRRARFSPSGIRKKLKLTGMKMVIEKCPDCGRDYPVSDDIERCPVCGSDLKLHRSALAQNENKISLDGEDDTGVS